LSNVLALMASATLAVVATAVLCRRRDAARASAGLSAAVLALSLGR